MFEQPGNHETSSASRVSSSLVDDLGLGLEDSKPEHKRRPLNVRMWALARKPRRKAPVVAEPTKKKNNDDTPKKMTC